MKKLVSLVIVMALVLSLAVGASAASITITPPAASAGTETGITYTAYKIFDATIVENADGSIANAAYTIKNTSPYYNTINTATEYFTLTQVAGTTDTYLVTKTDKYTKEVANTFADTLKNVTGATGITLAKAGNDYKAEGLENGYYLVTSSVGADLILETFGDVTATAKNEYPTITKDIAEATADKGSTLNITITVNIPEDAVGAIEVYDNMTGMTYQNMTTVDGITADNSPAEGSNWTVKFTLSDTYVTANKGKAITINYTAQMTADAIATNSAWLVDDTYTSTAVSDKVLTSDIVIDKYDAKNAETKLKDAKFVLKNEAGKFYAVDANGIVSWVDAQDNATVFTTDDKGAATIQNIANGTYSLVETEAPAGYNPLTEAKSVTVTAAEENGTVKSIEVDVENNQGSVLPSTGGMGTTIFYVLGGLMFVGALVLLVTNKRMKAE